MVVRARSFLVAIIFDPISSASVEDEMIQAQCLIIKNNSFGRISGIAYQIIEKKILQLSTKLIKMHRINDSCYLQTFASPLMNT